MAWVTPTNQSGCALVSASDWNIIINDLSYLSGLVEPMLYNQSGSTLAFGSVVISESGSDNSFNTTASARDPRVIGVLPESITAAACGRVAISGVISVNVSGSAELGDYLASSSTPGYAQSIGTSRDSSSFALSLTQLSSGSGQVTAIILPRFIGGSAPSNGVLWTTAGSSGVPSGFTEYTAAKGRVIVGMPSGGTLAGTVGTPMSNQTPKLHTHVTEDIVEHSHTMTTGSGIAGDAYFLQGAASAGTLTTDANVGGTTASFTNTFPYIQLVAIQKS